MKETLKTNQVVEWAVVLWVEMSDDMGYLELKPRVKQENKELTSQQTYKTKLAKY